MSKPSCIMPNWLGPNDSSKTSLLDAVDVVLDVASEQPRSLNHDTLKYVQADYPQYKRLKGVAGKREKLVWGGKPS